jgi:hypothetical protein
VKIVVNLPSAPTGIVAFAGTTAGQANVAWSTPATAGTYPITGYKVLVSPSTGVSGGVLRQVGLVNQYTFTGLAPNVNYTFTVYAVTSGGDGAASATTGVVKLTAKAPNAPQTPKIALNAAANLALNVTWTAPSSDNGYAITGYTVTLTGSDGSVLINKVAAGIYKSVFSGLNSTILYSATIVATNVGGNSPAATTSKLRPAA